MNFTYRRAASHDQAFLWDILYHAIYISPGEPPPPRETIFRPDLARYVEGWGKPTDLGIIALVYVNQPVGAAWLRLLGGDHRGYGHVDDTIPELSIAVQPEYRSFGVGTALLQRLLNAARDHFPGISLSVSNDNPARRLYERAGFNPIKTSGDSITMLLEFRHEG
jgi:ribosomal protein S18 acetylase RimI-like enzyme